MFWFLCFLPGTKLSTLLMLTVSYVSFLLDKSLQPFLSSSFEHLTNISWAIPTHSPLADRLRSSRFDVLLTGTWALGPPYRSINGIQVRALHRPVLGLCFVGRMRWCMNQFLFYCWQLEVFRIFINPSFFIIISTFTKSPRSRSTEAFLQQHTRTTVFHCRDCSLGCKPLPSFSKHKQRLSGHTSSMHDL